MDMGSEWVGPLEFSIVTYLVVYEMSLSYWTSLSNSVYIRRTRRWWTQCVSR